MIRARFAWFQELNKQHIYEQSTSSLSSHTRVWKNKRFFTGIQTKLEKKTTNGSSEQTNHPKVYRHRSVHAKMCPLRGQSDKFCFALQFSCHVSTPTYTSAHRPSFDWKCPHRNNIQSYIHPSLKADSHCVTSCPKFKQIPGGRLQRIVCVCCSPSLAETEQRKINVGMILSPIEYKRLAAWLFWSPS